MTVRELRQLLFAVDNQDAEVEIMETEQGMVILADDKTITCIAEEDPIGETLRRDRQEAK